MARLETEWSVARSDIDTLFAAYTRAKYSFLAGVLTKLSEQAWGEDR
jgi:hypothetical protein